MKRFMLILLCALLVLTTPLSALAAAPKIVDEAGVLSNDELLDLQQRADELVNQYGIDVVIVTVDSLNGKTSESYADDYFDENGYGIGPSHSGVLLLISMEYRDWAISTCGDGIYAITDYSIQNLFSQMAGHLSQDNFYLAFCVFLDSLQPVFEAFLKGDPIDGLPDEYDGPGSYIPGTQEDIIHYKPLRDFKWYASKIGISFAIGLVVALIALLIMRSQMNTAKPQHGAASYLKQDTYRVGVQRDIYLYSNVSKVRKSESSSSGGGSSVHRSSGGRSHGGGHGKF